MQLLNFWNRFGKCYKRALRPWAQSKPYSLQHTIHSYILCSHWLNLLSLINRWSTPHFGFQVSQSIINKNVKLAQNPPPRLDPGLPGRTIPMNILHRTMSDPPKIIIWALNTFRWLSGSSTPEKGVIFSVMKWGGIGSSIICYENGWGLSLEDMSGEHAQT